MKACESGRARQNCYVRVAGSSRPGERRTKQAGRPAIGQATKVLTGTNVPISKLSEVDSMLVRDS